MRGWWCGNAGAVVGEMRAELDGQRGSYSAEPWGSAGDGTH
jgi:hypothetical protein